MPEETHVLSENVDFGFGYPSYPKGTIIGLKEGLLYQALPGTTVFKIDENWREFADLSVRSSGSVWEALREQRAFPLTINYEDVAPVNRNNYKSVCLFCGESFDDRCDCDD